MEARRDEVILMYCTTWCGDSRRAKRALSERGVPYRWIDIETEPDAAERMLELNGGVWKMPTMLFPDGTVLVEPSNNQLLQHLERAA